MASPHGVMSFNHRNTLENIRKSSSQPSGPLPNKFTMVLPQSVIGLQVNILKNLLQNCLAHLLKMCIALWS